MIVCSFVQLCEHRVRLGGLRLEAEQGGDVSSRQIVLMVQAIDLGPLEEHPWVLGGQADRLGEGFDRLRVLAL